jgi:hypothetical protein
MHDGTPISLSWPRCLVRRCKKCQQTGKYDPDPLLVIGRRAVLVPPVDLAPLPIKAECWWLKQSRHLFLGHWKAQVLTLPCPSRCAHQALSGMDAQEAIGRVMAMTFAMRGLNLDGSPLSEAEAERTRGAMDSLGRGIREELEATGVPASEAASVTAGVRQCRR